MEIPKEILITFLGSYGCGKTTLLRRYFRDVLQEYDLKDGPTLSNILYFKTKEQHPMGLQHSALKCYDLGHSLDIMSQVSSSVMDAFVVCADICSEESIQTALLYLTALILCHTSLKLRRQPQYILCYTKYDDATRLRCYVGVQEAIGKLGIPIHVVFTSAKDGTGCDELFDEVIKKHLPAYFD